MHQFKLSTLVLLVLSSAFFPRIITAMGGPAIINFLHFLLVLILSYLMLSKIQNPISKKILIGLLVLFGLTLTSALINNAGVINVILDFLLLAEPFLLLVAIVGPRISQTSIKQFRLWLMLFSFVHLILIYYQFFVIRSYNPDDVKGVFLEQGAGHHVGGAVALATAIYFFMTYKSLSIWIRAFVAMAFMADIVFSDSKQVLVAFLFSLAVLLTTKFTSFRKTLLYFVLTIITVGFVYLAAHTFFPSSLRFWGTSGKFINGLEVKFSVFPIIISYYSSPLNWLFGLGPGHTIGRLGWLIPDYIEYLQPLGVTSFPATQAILYINSTNPLTNTLTGSSMFALSFSWAGVWGDLGLLGLGAYLYLWYFVWHLCSDDLSKFFLITILVKGGIFSWMEEPGYVLFMISLIGIQWQKNWNSPNCASQRPRTAKTELFR